MAIALLASTLKQANSASTEASSAIDTTGATLLVVVASYLYNAAVTLTDSAGNTWTPLTAYSTSASTRVRIYYCLSPSTSASHTFQLAGALSYPALAVAAFSGTLTASAFDVENGNFNNSGTTVATGTVTPSEGNELLIFGFSSNASGSYSVDVGTIANQAGLLGASAFGVALAYQIQTTATARNATWTSGSGTLAAAAATFKSAGGGGGGGGLSIPVAMNQYRQRWA